MESYCKLWRCVLRRFGIEWMRGAAAAIVSRAGRADSQLAGMHPRRANVEHTGSLKRGCISCGAMDEQPLALRFLYEARKSANADVV